MNKRFVNSSELADLLRKGSPAIFPTDTLPALGANPLFARQLWTIKNRKLDKPLILMGSSLEDLFKFASDDAINDALAIAKKYWPGPLTIVLPSSSFFVNDLNPVGQTVGMRVPNCSMTRNLLSKSGPLATTSANLSGKSPIISKKHLMECFPEIPLLAPIDWPIPSGLASTVIVWKEKGCWQLLRKGAVIPDECERFSEK